MNKRAVIVEFYSILKQYCNRGFNGAISHLLLFILSTLPQERKSLLCCSSIYWTLCKQYQPSFHFFLQNCSDGLNNFSSAYNFVNHVGILHWQPQEKIRTTCTAVTILSLQENKQNYHNAIPIPLLGCRSGAKNTSKCWQF